MRRILLGPLLFLLIGLALVLGLNRLAWRLAPPDPIEELRAQRLRRQQGDITTVSAGNSHAMAVDFPALGRPAGFHVWHGGLDLFETEVLLRQLVADLPRLDTVLLTFSFTIFQRDNAACTLAGRDRIRANFYALPQAYGLVDRDVGSFLKGRLAGLVRLDHWQAVWRGWRRRRQNLPVFPLTLRERVNPLGKILPDSDNRAARSAARLTASAVEIVDTHRWITANMRKNRPDLPAAAERSAGRIIEFLRAEGIRALYYTPPYWETYGQQMDADVVADWRMRLGRLVERYGITHHDFSTTPGLSSRPSLFQNGDHLNLAGSRLFSQRRLRPLLEAAATDN